MRSFIYFVIFMLFVKSCTSIKCVDETQVQLSSSELTLIKIKTVFNNLKSSDSVKCQAYMEFNSITQKFMIKFGQTLELPRLRSIENAYIHTVTSISSANPEKKMNQTLIKTIVRLVCYSNDGCDRQLILEHLDRLVKTNYKNLEFIIRPLILVQGDKKDECTIGNGDNVKSCNSTACSWYYSMDTKQGEGNCENKDLQILPTLDLNTEIRMFEKRKAQDDDIETKTSRLIFKHRSSIKFWCELNNCNNQTIGESIKETVSEYYDLWTMHKIHKLNRK